MIQYETLMLTSTQITHDELAFLEREFEKIATQAKGHLKSFDRWGKYRLAYPIKKNDYGVYILARYEVPQEVLSAVTENITTFFRIKCNDIVMRYINVRLAPGASSVYVKPEAVDAKGMSDIDSFIKENKMEGILSTKMEASSGLVAESSENEENSFEIEESQDQDDVA